MNQLKLLKNYSDIVADTGDLAAIGKFLPNDATTNPSLLLKVAIGESGSGAIRNALEKSNDSVSDAIDMFSVEVGCSILKVIPGMISTEVDARLSFDTEKTVEKAKTLISLYQNAGIKPERVLIKIAATWEGIRAAKILEKEGIHCNLTLVFSLVQAISCAEANVFLISPFVGRIYDWHKKQNPDRSFIVDDPGVSSVKEIYHYYKRYGYKTVVMGASFRNTNQVVGLAGCDKLTVSPALLELLEESSENVVPQLQPETSGEARPEPISESEFRLRLNENTMAHEKLGEGIRQFVADQVTLEKIFQNEADSQLAKN